MSDNQAKPDGGWEWELKQAEAKISSAPGGSPELAAGLYLQAQAIRNMFMGDIGQAYVNSLENAVERVIGAALKPLADGQKETHSGIAALSGQFQTLAETVMELEEGARAQATQHAALVGRVAKLEDDSARLKALEARLARLETQGNG